MGHNERLFRRRLRTQLTPFADTGDTRRMSHDPRERGPIVSAPCYEFEQEYMERTAAYAAAQPFRNLQSVARLLTDFTGKQEDEDVVPGMFCVESSFVDDKNTFMTNEHSKYIATDDATVTIRDVHRIHSSVGETETYTETKLSPTSIGVTTIAMNGDKRTDFYHIDDEEYSTMLDDATLKLLAMLKKTLADYAKLNRKDVKNFFPPLNVVKTLLPIIGQRITKPLHRIKHTPLPQDSVEEHIITTTHHKVEVNGTNASIRMSHAHWVHDTQEPLKDSVQRMEREFLHSPRVVKGSLILMQYDNDRCTEFLVYDRQDDSSEPFCAQHKSVPDLNHPENLRYSHCILLIRMLELLVMQDHE